MNPEHQKLLDESVQYQNMINMNIPFTTMQNIKYNEEFNYKIIIIEEKNDEIKKDTIEEKNDEIKGKIIEDKIEEKKEDKIEEIKVDKIEEIKEDKIEEIQKDNIEDKKEEIKKLIKKISKKKKIIIIKNIRIFKY